MNIHSQILHTNNKNLLVERYRHGFRIVESQSDLMQTPNSLVSLFDLPVSVYFYDADSNFVKINERCAKLIDAVSEADAVDKNPANFCSREFSDKIFAIDDSVIRNKSTHIIEEIGYRADDFLIQALAVKLPWYVDDKIIGLLGLSIQTDRNSVAEFAERMLCVLATGLLGQSENIKSIVMPKNLDNDIYLSKREEEILSHILRGCSAKMIADRLGLSKRTIEHHIENIKLKSNCASKYELIAKFHDMRCDSVK